MARHNFTLPNSGSREALLLLGGVYITSAIGYPLAIDSPIGIDLTMTILVGVPGLILATGGYWLARSEIRSEVYSGVVTWCLGGIGVMLALLGLTALAAGLRDPLQNTLILTAIGSVAGFAAGIHDARAKTRELELEETVKQLKASNERLEQFAYAASHDLQEPLRMVSTYLQLVERRADDELSDETEEYLEYAVDGADRMREMVRGLLEYSRVEREGEPFESVDLNVVVEDALEDMQMRIEESRTEVVTDTLPRVRGDANQLRQVIQNLVDNAIKYSGDEPPQITVSTDRNGAMCEVSVHDDGIGIDPEDQERVFEVFERLHTPDEYPGSGIGLAVSKRIIERHGGDIWVESEPGDGTTITFTLPTAETADQ